MPSTATGYLPCTKGFGHNQPAPAHPGVRRNRQQAMRLGQVLDMSLSQSSATTNTTRSDREPPVDSHKPATARMN